MRRPDPGVKRGSGKSTRAKVGATAPRRPPRKQKSSKPNAVAPKVIGKATTKAAVAASLGLFALHSLAPGEALAAPVQTPPSYAALQIENKGLMREIDHLQVALGKATSEREALVEVLVQEYKSKSFWSKAFWRDAAYKICFGVIGGVLTDLVFKLAPLIPALVGLL